MGLYEPTGSRFSDFLPYSAKTFYNLLRKLGFKRTDRCRQTQGSPFCHIYTKVLESGRKIDVQIWGDGQHRVSHWEPTMCTLPTDFHTLREMELAILYESVRPHFRELITMPWPGVPTK